MKVEKDKCYQAGLFKPIEAIQNISFPNQPYFIFHVHSHHLFLLIRRRYDHNSKNEGLIAHCDVVAGSR